MTTSSHKNEEVNRTRNVPFCSSTFTGKERDEETGYGYLPHQVRQAHHGARYMDHELMTMWLSVDPMAEKYPNISPYAYCAWNPVKLVDPDGMDGIPIIDKKKKTITVKVDIIFYMPNPGSIGRRKIDEWTNNFMVDINNAWNSHKWTYEYEGEQYNVNFKFTHKFDYGVHGEDDFKFDKKNNSKNYIEISGQSVYKYDSGTGKSIYTHRSYVRHKNRGKWYYNSEAAAHEVGHLLLLPDRYHEDNNSASGYSPDPGWEGTIMAEPESKGRVTQRDINEVLNKMLKANPE